MLKIQRVLCPIDFSDNSENALQQGCELALKLGAELHVLHVVEDSEALATPGNDEFAALFQDRLPKLRAQAEARLAERPGADWSQKLTVRRSTRVGSPVDEIVKYAQEQHIDLIVQGTHGRRGLQHFLLGSVAENVVRYAPCAVMTVRQTPSA